MTIEIPCSDPEVLAEAQSREGCEVWVPADNESSGMDTAAAFSEMVSEPDPITYTIRCSTPEVAGELLAWAKERGSVVQVASAWVPDDDVEWRDSLCKMAGQFATCTDGVDGNRYRILPPAEPEPWRPSKGERVRHRSAWYPGCWTVRCVGGDDAWVESAEGRGDEVVSVSSLAPWGPPTETVPWWEALQNKRTHADGWEISGIDWIATADGDVLAVSSDPDEMTLGPDCPYRYVVPDADGMVEVLREDTRP